MLPGEIFINVIGIWPGSVKVISYPPGVGLGEGVKPDLITI